MHGVWGCAPRCCTDDNCQGYASSLPDKKDRRLSNVNRVQRDLLGHRIHEIYSGESPVNGGEGGAIGTLRLVDKEIAVEEPQEGRGLFQCQTPDIPGRREPQTPRFVPVSTDLLTGHTYVEFLAVEAHVPEWQPSGRGPPQWNH
ncbi:hypothetical protein T02_4221 [Trichinella nativa]|uniref:Uncharacterized protein n=1 Tax=Trichinella nativa TaxID=6335 RepID=A0A0V1KML8_9BILA|nr:hypothetical protein T02_4221 [Trichinella nativa]